MELADLIIIIGLGGLYFYQHYKIKNLEDKTKDQRELLESIKTYFEVMNPELIKFRVDLHEKTLETQKNIEIQKISEEFSKQMEAHARDSKMVLSVVKDLSTVAFRALVYVPEFARNEIINQIEHKEMLQGFLEMSLILEELKKGKGKIPPDLVDKYFKRS